MQASNYMELGDCLGISGSCSLECFFKGHGVSPRRVFLAAEGAQSASCHTDIGGIQMTIDVEIRLVAMHPLAHMVCQPTDCQDIAATIKGKSILLRETFSGNDFVL